MNAYITDKNILLMYPVNDINRQNFLTVHIVFLAAQSSSRSHSVGWLVGPSVRPSVGGVCEKVTFRLSTGD